MRVRPLQVSDLEELSGVDKAHAAAYGTRTVLNRASAHFFERSGHSFVAESAEASLGGPRLIGFALALSSWGGAEAVVRLERIAVSPGAEQAATVAASLTAAVVKSAYDAGVYRLVASVAVADDVARGALEATMFAPEPNASYQRLLGSGALNGALGAVDDADVASSGGGEHD